MKGAEGREKRRVGRPRANGNRPTGTSREDILRAAGRLFAERGFVGTSTGQIAAAAGLRQPAIFHWFRTKEAILEELFSRGWDRSLEYFEEVADSGLPGAVMFCLCLTYDARFVAGVEPYIQVMIVPPELRQPRFKRLLRKRLRLIGYFTKFIQQAMREGDFRRTDAAVAARMVLAVDEVVLDAARLQNRRSPRAHASKVLEFALHAMVSDSARIDGILRIVKEHSKR